MLSTPPDNEMGTWVLCGTPHALTVEDSPTKKFGRVKLYFPVKSGMRETSGKALGRVYVANTSRPEGRSPAVLHALSYQWLFVACGRGCTHWHQSGSLPSPLDAAERSPAPEPRRRHPWPHGLWSRCGGCAACLGRARVWGRHTVRLLAAWQLVVQDDGRWQAHRHGSYRPVACDLVGF